jgi:hypothetical protein
VNAAVKPPLPDFHPLIQVRTQVERKASQWAEKEKKKERKESENNKVEETQRKRKQNRKHKSVP